VSLVAREAQDAKSGRLEKMDWDFYRYFLAVARSGSFAGAADKVGVSAQTVSRKVASLEEELGLKLLVKAHERYVLSAVGERLLPDVERMAETELRLQSTLAGARGSISGIVRVSVSDVLSGHWLVPGLDALTKCHPELNIDVLVDRWPVSVRRREADIVLRLFAPGEENLIGRKIGLIGAGFYASRAYAERYGLPQNRHDWHTHRVVGIASNSTLAHCVNHVARDAQIRMRCSSHNDVLTAVTAGLGIGLLVNLWGDAVPGLVRIAPSRLHRTADLWLLAHPDLIQTPAVRTVIDFITELAARDASRLEGVAGPAARPEPDPGR